MMHHNPQYRKIYLFILPIWQNGYFILINSVCIVELTENLRLPTMRLTPSATCDVDRYYTQCVLFTSSKVPPTGLWDAAEIRKKIPCGILLQPICVHPATVSRTAL